MSFFKSMIIKKITASFGSHVLNSKSKLLRIHSLHHAPLVSSHALRVLHSVGGNTWLRSVSRGLKCVVCHSVHWEHPMAAEARLSTPSPVIGKHFKACLQMDGWMKAIDVWMDRWRKRGTGCATSCLDPLLPSSVHIERHSEGHGCLWKCLCELLPSRKYLRSFSVWHL